VKIEAYFSLINLESYDELRAGELKVSNFNEREEGNP